MSQNQAFLAIIKKSYTNITTWFKKSYSNLTLWFNKFNNSEFVGGFKEGWHESRPLAYIHNTIIMRIFRVLGGISVAISIVLYKVYPSLFEQYIPTGMAFYVFVFAIFFGSYILLYSLVTLVYTMYLIVTGKWIKRNSPLRFLFSSGKLAGFCWNSTCAVFQGGIAVGSGTVVVDTLIGWTGDPSLEPYRPQTYVKNMYAQLRPGVGPALDENLLAPANNLLALEKDNERLKKLVENIVSKEKFIRAQDELNTVMQENMSLAEKNAIIKEQMSKTSKIVIELMKKED